MAALGLRSLSVCSWGVSAWTSMRAVARYTGFILKTASVTNIVIMKATVKTVPRRFLRISQ